jgi:hypothetical protein
VSESEELPTDYDDLGERFGAYRIAVQERFAIYIPDRDKNGNVLDVTIWIRRAMQLLDGIDGGATAMPAALGIWRGQEENTVIVYSFIDQDRFFGQIFRVRAFLHEFGRTMSQGEVLFELGPAAFWIDQYDPELKS